MTHQNCVFCFYMEVLIGLNLRNVIALSSFLDGRLVQIFGVSPKIGEESFIMTIFKSINLFRLAQPNIL